VALYENTRSKTLDLARRTKTLDEYFLAFGSHRDEWRAVLAERDADVPDRQIEDILRELIHHHFDFRCWAWPALADELVEFVIALFGTADATELAMQVGLDVWHVLVWHTKAPLADHPAWRILYAVTRGAAGNESLLETLGVCWYEDLPRDERYLDAFLADGIDLPMAVDLASHTGSMSAHHPIRFRRRLQDALPHKDVPEFRRRCQERGLPL
jgi:hypothetical protein